MYRIAIYILAICLPLGASAQDLAKDLLQAFEKFNKAEYAYLDVDILMFDTNKDVKPSSTFKGKVVRSKDGYYVQNDFMYLASDEKMMVLLNKLDKTVSCRQLDPKSNKALFKEIESFDFSVAMAQMDSMLKKALQVKLLYDNADKRTYEIDFPKGLYKSLRITFASGFISEITYWYNEAVWDANSKTTIKYQNVSFEPGATAMPLQPSDIVIKNSKGSFTLAPAYKNYELIIINDDEQ